LGRRRGLRAETLTRKESPMAKSRGKQKGAKEEPPFLTIEVQDYTTQVDASLHLDLHRDGGRPFGRDEECAYTYETAIEITGVCTYPSQRASDTYELQFSGKSPRCQLETCREAHGQRKAGDHQVSGGGSAVAGYVPRFVVRGEAGGGLRLREQAGDHPGEARARVGGAGGDGGSAGGAGHVRGGVDR